VRQVPLCCVLCSVAKSLCSVYLGCTSVSVVVSLHKWNVNNIPTNDLYVVAMVYLQVSTYVRPSVAIILSVVGIS
jgi:hypothetical protein